MFYFLSFISDHLDLISIGAYILIILLVILVLAGGSTLGAGGYIALTAIIIVSLMCTSANVVKKYPQVVPTQIRELANVEEAPKY